MPVKRLADEKMDIGAGGSVKVRSVVDLDESGKTIEQQIEDAIALFQSENAIIDASEAVLVWRFLPDKPKWRGIGGRETKAARQREEAQEQAQSCLAWQQ